MTKSLPNYEDDASISARFEMALLLHRLTNPLNTKVATKRDAYTGDVVLQGFMNVEIPRNGL